jgi:hypothetical protein
MAMTHLWKMCVTHLILTLPIIRLQGGEIEQSPYLLNWRNVDLGALWALIMTPQRLLQGSTHLANYYNKYVSVLCCHDFIALGKNDLQIS